MIKLEQIDRFKKENYNRNAVMMSIRSDLYVCRDVNLFVNYNICCNDNHISIKCVEETHNLRYIQLSLIERIRVRVNHPYVRGKL